MKYKYLTFINNTRVKQPNNLVRICGLLTGKQYSLATMWEQWLRRVSGTGKSLTAMRYIGLCLSVIYISYYHYTLESYTHCFFLWMSIFPLSFHGDILSLICTVFQYFHFTANLFLIFCYSSYTYVYDICMLAGDTEI